MAKIEVLGSQISTIKKFNNDDYISLTDMARHKNPDSTGLVISHWMSTRYTVEFMGVWERLNNAYFNVTEFSNIRNESGSNGFVLSSKQWIEKTHAIGIISKTGRYNGGTFAHKDIAFEFASWISVEFKLYLNPHRRYQAEPSSTRADQSPDEFRLRLRSRHSQISYGCHGRPRPCFIQSRYGEPCRRLGCCPSMSGNIRYFPVLLSKRAIKPLQIPILLFWFG